MKKLKLIFLLGAFIFLFIALLYGPSGSLFKNQYDDSYITYRYAINLATGNGLVFNPHDLTDAASSFLYTVVLALFYKIGVTNLEFVGALIGILSAIGISYLVYESCLFLTKKNWLSILFGALIGIHGSISGWAVSGMESVLFTFFVTLFIYLYYLKKSRNYRLITLVLLAILLTRMEGILLVGVWFIHECYSIYKKKKILKPFIVQCLVLGSVTIGLYAFKYLYYGTLISNAVAFKEIATYYQSNPTYFLMVWGGTSALIVILALYSIFKKLVNIKDFWSLYLYLGISLISFLVGPHSDGARYSIHILPIVFILGVLAIQDLSKKKKKILTFILVSGLIMQTLASTFAVRHFMVALSQGQVCRQKLGEYLSIHAPSAYVLSGDVGMIAYKAPNVNFIDLAGLTSQDVLKQYEKKQPLDEIFLTKKPKFIADTFFVNPDGSLEHPLLLNKVEHIVGMHTYSHLFSAKTFKKVSLNCSDGQRAYAVVDISTIYR